jgi:hypothetical protein
MRAACASLAMPHHIGQKVVTDSYKLCFFFLQFQS